VGEGYIYFSLIPCTGGVSHQPSSGRRAEQAVRVCVTPVSEVCCVWVPHSGVLGIPIYIMFNSYIYNIVLIEKYI
jgi:hypothetical protein